MAIEEAGKTERQLRHIDLFEAVRNDLCHAIARLEALRDAISGQEKPPSGDEKSPSAPAAGDVYAKTPEEIRELSQRICTFTDEIRKLVL